MSLVTKVRVGDKKYTIDMNKFMNVELMAIEKVTGWTTMEWQMKLNMVSATAVTALVWILRKRSEDPTLQFEDVEFDVSAIEIEWQDDKEDEVKKETQDSQDTPQSESQTVTSSTSSNSSSLMV